MNKNLLNLAFITFLSTSLFAQVGINTDSPSSTLDVSVKMNGTNLDNSQAYGLQAPRLSREELSNITATYGENQKGALVYITDISGGDIAGQRVNVTQVGYYYFDGLVWQKLAGQAVVPGGIASAWNVGGTDTPATIVDGNIYHNGLIGINTRTPISAIHITGDGGDTDDILVRSNSASAGSAGQLNLSRSKGTATAPTTVANGDRVGDIVFSPYGSSYLDTASIRALVNGTVAAGSIPTDLLFLTGASTGTEKMRITSNGNVGIGTSSPLQLLDVNGTMRLAQNNTNNTPNAIHAYSGETSSASTLNRPLYVDTTNGQVRYAPDGFTRVVGGYRPGVKVIKKFDGFGTLARVRFVSYVENSNENNHRNTGAYTYGEFTVVLHTLANNSVTYKIIDKNIQGVDGAKTLVTNTANKIEWSQAGATGFANAVIELKTNGELVFNPGDVTISYYFEILGGT